MSKEKYDLYYGNIKYCDTADGPGMRIALYVSGCTRCCEGCHNMEAWNFEYGFKLTHIEVSNIVNNLKENYNDGFSILGGEPLEERNRNDVFRIIETVHTKVPDKNIWLWTSYTFEEILEKEIIPRNILEMIDVIVDGPFVFNKRNLKLRYRGSSNQRIVDVKESLKQNEIVLWETEYNENNVYSGHTFRKIK